MDEELEKSIMGFVKENLECEEELQEILAISLIAVILLKGERALQKLPTLLQSLRISYDDKTIKDQEKKKCMERSHHNYGVIYNDTCFKGYSILEEKHLLIDKKHDYETGLIKELVYSFLKELRSFPPKHDEDFLEKRTGISVCRRGIFDKEDHKTNEALEEALEEYETKQAMEALFEFLDQKKLESSVVEKLYQERNANYLYIYSIYVHFLEQLMNDNILKNTLLNPETEKDVKKGIYYYNTMMEDEGAFAKLNRLFQRLKEALEKNKVSDINKYTKLIQQEIDNFNKKPKKYRLK